MKRLKETWQALVDAGFAGKITIFFLVGVAFISIALVFGLDEDSLLYAARSASFIALFIYPIWSKIGYRLRQDALLDKIRARYTLALAALETSRRKTAEGMLRKVRRLEEVWRFGMSRTYRYAMIAKVVAVTGLLFSVYGVLFQHTNFMHDISYTPKTVIETALHLSKEPLLLLVIASFGMLYGLVAMAATISVPGPRWGKFYGDRLEAILNAGAAIGEAPQHESGQLPGEGVSARELFGLLEDFTKRELRRAWLRLARELHPDRWGSAGEGVRQMKETALKRVNAARDELETHAI